MFCLAFVSWRSLPGSSIVRSQDHQRIVEIAQSQIGIKEATGNNDGVQVEKYLTTVGLKKGQPWCAAFFSWIFKQAGYDRPNTGWSPQLFPAARNVKTASPGLAFGIYISSLNRIAHCGVVEQVNGTWVMGIEGNTNVSGSRDGDGVYRKLRHIKTIHRFADWIPNNPKKKGGVF